ncbi:MAG: type III pantothenate kinase [Candidatus Omnitrophica bacterium]|nr:type III pantothenate kinase [Candidatus Omnitrophota bacterium]
MILAVDIGNTAVSLGVIKGERVHKVYAVETRAPRKRLCMELKQILKRVRSAFPHIETAIICSVVPKVLGVCEQMIGQCLVIKPIVVGRDVKVPMRNNYHNPRQVGQDRLVCAYAAKCLYGWPVIILDFGTATTIDVVSHRGSYEGGLIIPGIRLSAESLFQNTALLPRIKAIKQPRSLVGKDTRGSILSGLFFGYGAMCCGLIGQISKTIKGKTKVIVTGGYTQLMKRYISNKITKIDRNLVFKGMQLLIQNTALP